MIDGREIDLEVDGGVTADNAMDIVAAGATGWWPAPPFSRAAPSTTRRT